MYIQLSSRVILESAFVVFCLPSLVLAQADNGPVTPAGFDTFGNARFEADPYREVQVPNAQPAPIGGEPTLFSTVPGRNPSRRFVYSGLPGEVIGRSRGVPTPGMSTFLPMQRMNPATEWSYKRFGGFDEREQFEQEPSLSLAMSRKNALFRATGLNAPVNRALMGSYPRGELPVQNVTPLVQTDAPSMPEQSATLEDRLVQTMSVSHERIRTEAWAGFQSGEYRRALHAFESALVLSGERDVESRIGQLFCHLALGAYRTSFVVFRQWLQVDPNPFGFSLDLSTIFRPEDARRVRLESQAAAEAASSPPEAAAMYVLVLWYLGARDDAALVGADLGRRFPTTPFADWPAKMKAARVTPAEGIPPAPD